MTPIKTLEEAKKEFKDFLLKETTLCSAIDVKYYAKDEQKLWSWFESTLSSLTEQMIPEEINLDFENRVFRYLTGILGQYGKPLEEMTELNKYTLHGDVVRLNLGIINYFISEIRSRRDKLLGK